jgi:hypothetical protein
MHGMENVKYSKFFRSKTKGQLQYCVELYKPFELGHQYCGIEANGFETRYFCNTVYIKQFLFQDSHSLAVLLFYDRNQPTLSKT